MFSSDRKLTVFVVICCIILALLGYGWKHRTIIPYVTVPLEKVTTPFAYGASRVLDGVHTGITVIDNAIAATKKIEALARPAGPAVQHVGARRLDRSGDRDGSRVATSRLLEAGLVLVSRVQTPASSVIFAESPIGDRLQPPNLRSRNQDSIARACACLWALAPKSYRPCLRHSDAPTIAPVSPNL